MESQTSVVFIMIISCIFLMFFTLCQVLMVGYTVSSQMKHLFFFQTKENEPYLNNLYYIFLTLLHEQEFNLWHYALHSSSYPTNGDTRLCPPSTNLDPSNSSNLLLVNKCTISNWGRGGILLILHCLQQSQNPPT